MVKIAIVEDNQTTREGLATIVNLSSDYRCVCVCETAEDALPQGKLVELVLADLRALLGVKGRSVFQHCAVFQKAIPQYNVGYGKYKQLLNGIEAKNSNLFFAGHYRDGVSLGDSIVSGVNIAERVGNLF